MTKHNLTVRVSDEQRALLERRAGNRPLADYIRQKLDIEETPKRARAYKPQTDQVMLARILAALGSSDYGCIHARHRRCSAQRRIARVS